MGSTVPRANTPALLAAFGGQAPVELVVAGQVVPADEHTALSLRRSRPTRDPIGTPASCSGQVAVATPPSWRKGDKLQVRMTEWALDVLFGEPVRTNYAQNAVTDTGTVSTGIGPSRGTLSVGAGYLRLTVNDTLLGGFAQRFNTSSSAMYLPIQPGQTWTVSSDTRSNTGAKTGVMLIWLNDANQVVGQTTAGAWVATDATKWSRPYATATAPAGATKLAWYVGLLNSGEVAVGEWLDMRHLLIEQTDHPAPYFDGNSPDTFGGPGAPAITGDPVALGSATLTPGAAVGFGGYESWTRVAPSVNSHGARVMAPAGSAVPASPVVGWVRLGNDGATPVTVTMDINDDPGTTQAVVVGPGEWFQVEVGPSNYPTNTVTYTFLDVTGQAGTSFLIAPVSDGYADAPRLHYVETADYAQVGAVGSNTAKATRTRTEALAARNRARYRFSGRLTDVKLDARLTGPAMVSIIGTGRLAELGNLYVGDKPWPSEGAVARAQRILDQAKLQSPTLAFQVNLADTFPVPARDVDRQPVQGLLEDLAPALGPRAGVNEWRDGTLQLDTGYTDTLPSIGLAGEACQLPLAFDQAEVVNDVTLELGKPPAGTLLYRNLTANPHAEVSLLNYQGLQTTTAIARDTTKGVYRLTSARVTASSALAGFGIRHIQTIATGWAYNGQVVTHTAFAASSRAHTLRFTYYWKNGGTVVQSGTKDYAWPGDGKFYASTLVLEAPADPVDHLELDVTTVDVATVGDQLWLVAGCAQDITSYAPGVVSSYFDGSLTDTLARDYAWDGPVGDGLSVVYAGAEPDPISVRQVDQPSIDAQGVHAITVKQDVAWDSPDFAWGAFDPTAWFLTAGEWGLPELTVDVLPLLDGRVPAITTTITGDELPDQLAGTVLQAELGAMRSVRLPQGQPGHMPPVDVDVAGGDGAITALNETITAHRWTVTTSAERTF